MQQDNRAKRYRITVVADTGLATSRTVDTWEKAAAIYASWVAKPHAIYCCVVDNTSTSPIVMRHKKNL
jgi:hypothetical protein